MFYTITVPNWWRKRGCTNFERGFVKIKWNILGIAEVRKHGESFKRRKNGNILYYYGTTKGYRRVGFFIDEK